MTERTDAPWGKEDRGRAEDKPVTPQSGNRGGYLGFVAHEVRNPLSTALWSAELLSRMTGEERAGPRGEKLAAMSLRALTRVRLLVEDHFLSERLDAHGLPVRLERVSLDELVQGVLGHRDAAGKVVVAIEPGLAAASDRSLLERAVDGLLAAASQGDGEVHVTGRAERDWAVLRFHGAPPPANALEDPDRGTASDPKGRVLALPMARRVAQVLGGELAVVQVGYELRLPGATGHRGGEED